MKYIQKQAMIKLAQVRLAINHVLRGRMVKKAEIDHTTWYDRGIPYDETYPKGFIPPSTGGVPLPRSYDSAKFKSFPRFRPVKLDDDIYKEKEKNDNAVKEQQYELYNTTYPKSPLPFLPDRIQPVPTPTRPDPYSYFNNAARYINEVTATNEAKKRVYDTSRNLYENITPELYRLQSIYDTLYRLKKLPNEWNYAKHSTKDEQRLEDITNAENDYKAMEPWINKAKADTEKQLNPLETYYNSLYNKASKPYGYDSHPDVIRALDEANKNYNDAKKSIYFQDLNRYRQIRNEQLGLKPNTKLIDKAYYVTRPIDVPEHILNRHAYPMFYSPVTGKPRSYFYDAINNPYYDAAGYHPFGEKQNFEKHYPLMQKQWKRQDRWDRGVQKFNQAVDKAEPLMGALSGKWKPIFNAASLARQGVKTIFPEYWQRPKRFEENGIYTEY